jgi:hypothetical protein
MFLGQAPTKRLLKKISKIHLAVLWPIFALKGWVVGQYANVAFRSKAPYVKVASSPKGRRGEVGGFQNAQKTKKMSKTRFFRFTWVIFFFFFFFFENPQARVRYGNAGRAGASP